MLYDTRQTYGSVSRILHWVVGLSIMGLVIVGWIMTDMAPGPSKGIVYGLHKSVGVTVLIVAFVRILWRWRQNGPDPVPGPRLLQVGAHIVHGALYVLMVLIPLSGFLMSLYNGHSVSFFGLFQLDPQTTGPTPFGAWCRTVHMTIWYGLLILLTAHVLGALYHHFIRKDDTLRRMMPWVR